MSRYVAIAMLGAALAVPSAAQVRSAPAGRAGGGFAISFGPSRGAGVHMRGDFQRGQQSPFLLGAPYFYGDSFSNPVIVEPPPPQIVVTPAPLPAEPVKEPLPEALLIELQGDRYVRVDSAQARGTLAATDYAEAKTPAVRVAATTAAPASPLAPVVLVYRDGHREEIRDYTIADGIIYARGDYWTDGYWSKKIQLAGLDVRATVKASSEHGVRFVLPTSPNEVVTRP